VGLVRVFGQQKRVTKLTHFGKVKFEKFVNQKFLQRFKN